ncbi:hypothetical protein PAE9249_01015 [Paenibacillus sp. CECT 9249]|uniref:hypothetical protein n=1 Tax=Paenibacillus sp. CECT 9249 TaxID=2845385 RepID=UPI001E2BCC1A|nr:hypothetical protein [Paenibacillus sp. CECT 9249]CAH0118526.1 hypothetical protein PAE9249_01015 [Paenibacillus sp. CECT 9249]
MKKYALSDEVINNLLVFLDRVKYEGLKETVALNDILQAISKPADETEGSGAAVCSE